MRKKEILWLREEKHRKAENEQLQPSLSRYASCYSWNSYSYSISLCVGSWIFNILLIGVDEKGRKLFCWYWLLTYFVSNLFVIFPLAWAHWKIMRCGFTCFWFSFYSSCSRQLFIWGWFQGLGIQSWDSAKRSNASKFCLDMPFCRFI